MSGVLRDSYINLLIEEREKEREAMEPEKMKPGEFNS
jgi:hypothetical protein